jgi:hypothetical protein
MNRDPKKLLAELMASNDLNAESRFYRHTLPEFLEPAGEGGLHRLSANDDPSEAVVDVYGGGHISLAMRVGPGLAFAETAESEWQDSDRVCVEVHLADVLEQGGLIYPVESVITDRVWYMTLPSGGVTVRVAD